MCAPVHCKETRVATLVEAIRKNLNGGTKVSGIENDGSSGEVVFVLRDGKRYALSHDEFLSLYEPLN